MDESQLDYLEDLVQQLETRIAPYFKMHLGIVDRASEYEFFKYTLYTFKHSAMYLFDWLRQYDYQNPLLMDALYAIGYINLHLVSDHSYKSYSDYLQDLKKAIKELNK